jgi:hypothetical protein
VDGAPVPSPAELVGPDPKRSIEVWAWNPALATEESMVAWGRRGTDGGNMSFNYGSSGGAGAVTHFGQADIGWGATRPPAGQWHHLVYTYDGTTTRVYSDGVLINSEFLGEQALDTIAGSPISLGTQYGGNGAPAAANRASLTLGRVRVYSGILTPEQIQADFNAEKAGYAEPSGIPPPPPPAPLSAPPIHRYSFTNPAGPATDGQEIIDSIGGANGNVRGTGATWNATGTRLVLPGGSSATAPFVDLPNGLLSSMGVANEGTGKLSIEGWAKQTASRTWSRFFDFGSSVAGELSAPGGTGNGIDYFMLSQNAGDTTLHRFELTDNAGNPANRIADFTTATFNTDLHYVATWDETTGEVHLYEQGIEVANYVSPTRMSAINDVNNWLGRSNYTGDLNFQGEFDEFRIYDHVLTEAEVRGNLQAGPNVVTGGTPTVSDVFVRGSAWTPEFKTYLENKGLGDDVYGFRVFGTGSNAADVLPWINMDEVVLKYAAAPTGSGIPTQGTVTFTSANGQTYTATAVTPVAGDPTAFVVTLSQPLGGGNPTTGVAPTPAQNGDRVTVGVPGGGPAGTAFSYRMNVLQGDTDHTGETGGEHSVLAADFSAVKKKFFKDTTSPVTGTDVDYSAFHDVNGSGNILANDFSEVKKRFFQNLAAPPAAAARLTLSGVSKDLFSSSAIL